MRAFARTVNPLKIAITLNWYGWWGKNFPPDVLDREDSGSFAGGETHMLEGALGLAEAGHQVTVFSDLIRPSRHRGVLFRSLRDFLRAHFFDGDRPDVLLSYLQPAPLAAVPRETVRIFVQQCNDLDFDGAWPQCTDAIVAASASHAKYLASLFDPASRQIRFSGPYEVVHNGCHLEKYPATPPAPQSRPPLVSYWSSPDRGLHHLLEAWPFVIKQRPDAKLRVHYEIDRVFRDLMMQPSPTGGIEPGQARLRRVAQAVERAKAIPSIKFTGMLSRPALRRSQLETRVMCYPLDPGLGYTEGFGGSVAESMAAGALPLLYRRDAFPSIFGGACRWIEGETTDRNFAQILAKQIVEALDWDGVSKPSMADLRARAERWSWTNSKVEMIRAVERCYARKHGLEIPEPAFPLEPV